MRSHLTLVIAVLIAAVLITALCVAAHLIPVWAVLVVVLVLVALAILVVSKPVADVRYTFLAGAGGGVAAAVVFWAIPGDSGILSFSFAAVLAIGAGALSGRRQHRYRRGLLGVTAAAAASTLIAGVLTVAVSVVAILVYASVACSHYVNSCPFD